jgi:hypothetical protein
MKWWRMNFCPRNKTRPRVERSVRSSEQAAAGQPTGGLPLGLVGLELVSTFRRIACFLENNQHILTNIRYQLHLTSNTLPADLGINCQSNKPGEESPITKWFENVYGGRDTVTEPRPPLLGSSVLKTIQYITFTWLFHRLSISDFISW